MDFTFALTLVYGFCLLGAILTAIGAAWSDIRSMTIPNYYSIIIIGLFIMGYGALALAGAALAPWWSYASSMLIVFLVTLVMFLAKAIGGGDSKFGAACALWVGLQGLMPFLLVMMIVGMVLGILALVLRHRVVFARVVPGGWIDRVQKGESAIPYGVAIMFGLAAGVYAAGMQGPLMAFFH
ncbi:A24 family peptidase [Micavibrio aeruginosavorus]|uniref:A24 family peptidase n=1 Tax=Micavibrio aeruginosavorus TaxID=349221 RepID=UPI003F4AC5DE